MPPPYSLLLLPPLLLMPPSHRFPTLAAMASSTEARSEEIEPQTGSSEDIGAIPTGFDVDLTFIATSRGVLQGGTAASRGVLHGVVPTPRVGLARLNLSGLPRHGLGTVRARLAWLGVAWETSEWPLGY
jgi:hypothetical protein